LPGAGVEISCATSANVLHDIKPFEGEGERITIAFNCWFTLPDA